MPTDYAQEANEYRQLAIDLARGMAGPPGTRDHAFAVSHWNLADEYVDRHGWTRAACGRTVKTGLITGDPTCTVCRSMRDAYNDLKIG
jgi:hypothetical protein